MKQENLGLLLRLISNYVNHCDDIQEAKRFLSVVTKYPELTLTKDDKEKMCWNTVHALNAGNEEADRCAFEIRLRALCSGDEELIEKIEYLHKVL